MKLLLSKKGEGRSSLLNFRHSPQFQMSDQNYLSLQRHIAKSYAFAQVMTLFDKKKTMFILILKSFTNSCIVAIRYIVSNNLHINITI